MRATKRLISGVLGAILCLGGVSARTKEVKKPMKGNTLPVSLDKSKKGGLGRSKSRPNSKLDKKKIAFGAGGAAALLTTLAIYNRGKIKELFGWKNTGKEEGDKGVGEPEIPKEEPEIEDEPEIEEEEIKEEPKLIEVEVPLDIKECFVTGAKAKPNTIEYNVPKEDKDKKGFIKCDNGLFINRNEFLKKIDVLSKAKVCISANGKLDENNCGEYAIWLQSADSTPWAYEMNPNDLFGEVNAVRYSKPFVYCVKVDLKKNVKFTLSKEVKPLVELALGVNCNDNKSMNKLVEVIAQHLAYDYKYVEVEID